MHPVSGLIFDLDGTLVDSVQDIADALNHTLRILGQPLRSEKEVRGFVGDGVKVLLTRAAGRDDEEFLEKAVAVFKPYYFEHCTDRTRLYPGVEETLRHFQNKKKAVISNKPADMVAKTLEHFGIRSCFEAALGAESAARRKPHPEPILKTLEVLGLPAEACLMVGDGLPDIQAGQSAGLRTCAVTYGYRARAELEKLKPDFFIDRIADLKGLIA